MTGHATQQHVILECRGICQLVNTSKSSIPDHKLNTPIWRLTAAQHLAYFQRQLRSLGVSHQHCTLHGLRGGGATDHWLWYRDFPLLRRSGRWTSERTLERYIQEGTFPLDKKSSLQRSCRPSRCSRRARASFLCGPTTSPHSHHGATERVPGGVHSVLRSGVEQRSFAHTVSLLGALPLSLGDVGAKTKCKQTMHTMRARTHWGGSCSLTRTAVCLSSHSVKLQLLISV